MTQLQCLTGAVLMAIRVDIQNKLLASVLSLFVVCICGCLGLLVGIPLGLLFLCEYFSIVAICPVCVRGLHKTKKLSQ
jgi:hypothetical protein